MRQVIKHKDSPLNRLKYKENSDNSKIKNLLLHEQHHICAYTETYLDASDLEEIEHFNPNLKSKNEDNYQNWFLVKAKWNRRKSNKWIEPILHPTANDFEKRIAYTDGEYYVANENDLEAINLMELLMLKDIFLTEKRKKYIARIKDELSRYQHSTQEFFDNRIKIYPDDVYFIRAIETEFQVKIKFPQ